MKDSFDAAFNALIENEGGYSNNPADPGGETMYGVTKRLAVKHGYTGDMRTLTLDTARAIAKSEFWDPVDGDTLPTPLDFQVFDAAYNSGVSQAKVWLTRAYSPATDDVDKLVMRFDAYRLDFLAGLKTWPNFGRGWVHRVAKNLLRASV